MLTICTVAVIEYDHRAVLRGTTLALSRIARGHRVGLVVGTATSSVCHVAAVRVIDAVACAVGVEYIDTRCVVESSAVGTIAYRRLARV